LPPSKPPCDGSRPSRGVLNCRWSTAMKAIVVGGGIGGLTTALMLRARGIGCELFEQAETIRELGVGINTLPHAIRELATLGLLQQLDDVAIRTDVLYYLNRHGQEVWRDVRGIDAGHDVPQFSIHRGRLQSVIHLAVEERLGREALHTGCRLGRRHRPRRSPTWRRAWSGPPGRGSGRSPGSGRHSASTSPSPGVSRRVPPVGRSPSPW